MMVRGVKNLLSIFLVVIFVIALGAGCTKYAKEEDLQNLEKQKQAAIAAEKKRDQLNQQKSQVEQRKAAKEAELKTVEAEKAKVQSRM